ncbi:MAG: EF-hand domain-containing protein, partial [Marinobacter sp.]
SDPEKEFAAIDGNQGGEILFDEFADWALRRSLNQEGDDEDDFNRVIGSNGSFDSSLSHYEPPKATATEDRPRIDWDKINSKLPTDKTDEQKAKRKELFYQFDPNGNGYLSLAEVDRGCRDVLGLYEIFNCKKVIMRAYQAAKGANNEKTRLTGDKLGQDYVERTEFRLLLVYLKRYFQIWRVFDVVDTGHDHRINLDEFAKALPLFKEWGVTVDDPAAIFNSIDKNGGGEILFDEFADWALLRGINQSENDKEDYSRILENSEHNGTATKYRYYTPPPASTKAKMEIDWDKINELLPTERTEAHRARRKELFQQFDPNGNGYLSLAEVDRACLDVLRLYDIFNAKRVIIRAFQAAKSANDERNKETGDELGAHFVEWAEFRLLLVYLKRYLEIWQIFDYLDQSEDHRVDLEEFKAALPELSSLGVRVEDPEQEFAAIDTNGGGSILFDEFADWALRLRINQNGKDEKDFSRVIGSNGSFDESYPRYQPQKEQVVDDTGIKLETLYSKLPIERTEEDKEKRKKLFVQFDPNGNGYLSLAEVDRGCRDVLGLYELYDCKKVIMRAFQAAKGANDERNKETGDVAGSDYVEWSEFRLLLVYLRRYFEIWQVFNFVDTS